MGRKPDDFYKTFCGNIDDGFKIGISVTKKAVKLYTDFYSSDILIASPLGLRLVLETDADFLSSIELLVMDQVLPDLQLILGNSWCRYPSMRLGLKGNRSCYTSAYT